MNFVKIIHYVEKSYDDKPSFVILMSDGKEYISNGCIWVENTEENIVKLIEEFDCKDELDELFNSSSVDMSSVVDTRYMFYKSPITSFNSGMPSVTDASWMFADSQLTSFSGGMSSVVDASWMFADSQLTSFSGDMSSVTEAKGMFYGNQLTSFNNDMTSVTDASWMFSDSRIISFNGDMSSVVDASCMFSYSPITSFNGDMSSVTDASGMFYNSQLASLKGGIPAAAIVEHMFENTPYEQAKKSIHGPNNPATVKTPMLISSKNDLLPHEVFVFGSNKAGIHGAGAAKTAFKYFGAVYGEGVGHMGQSYAIPTKDYDIETLRLEVIKKYVKDFIAYAATKPYLTFIVTAIGCGFAGYTPKDIAPMFKDLRSGNIVLASELRAVLLLEEAIMEREPEQSTPEAAAFDPYDEYGLKPSDFC